MVTFLVTDISGDFVKLCVVGHEMFKSTIFLNKKQYFMESAQKGYEVNLVVESVRFSKIQ